MSTDNSSPELPKGEMPEGTPHYGAHIAMDYIRSIDQGQLLIYAESFSSVSMSGNHLASVCSETMSRILGGRPVSDRYLMGLAWVILNMERKNVDFPTYLKGLK